MSDPVIRDAVITMAAFVLLVLSLGFIAFVWRISWGVRGFVDAQKRSSDAVMKMAESFQLYFDRQASFNERFENALEVFGGRLSDIEMRKTHE